MGLILRLSLRNLFRQKRRNLLLGIGISFGMMILVIANSFSHGMVDVLINDVVSYAFGHLVVQSHPGNSAYVGLIPDKERIMKIVRENVKKEDLVSIEETLGMFGQAIGNGEADNMVVVGVTLRTEKDKKDFFQGFFTLVEGNFDDYFRKDIEYPVIVSQSKAKSLNVKLYDEIRVRLPMVTGQIQAAKLTVIAIANANNSFMDIVAFMDGERVKKLLGYKPWESANLQLTLKNPQLNAKKYADLLQQKLKPGIIAIEGKAAGRECRVLAFQNDDKAKQIISRNLQIVSGKLQDGLAKDGVMLPRQLAAKLHLQVGRDFRFQYPTKFRGVNEVTFKVSAIYDSPAKLGGNVILVNGERVYNLYDRFLPARNDWGYISATDPLYQTMATEWKLLPRSADSEALQKKYKDERRVKTDQTKMDLVTMYEGASDILKLEGVLNLITIIAVLILFFIILIGVVNTLRMTIRERTREIGTVRAIGMQKKDVRNEFIVETLLLTAGACLVGIIAGVIVMQILSSVTFQVNNAFSMILKEKHLFFKLDPLGIMANFILIMAITGVTAYFPAKRAANLHAVEALRHYE